MVQKLASAGTQEKRTEKCEGNPFHIAQSII
uniref:Uncharacterized protein n=1 Tax=Arundo donax TaxID=35708 RepID=A0A0A8Z956_ARUDO